MNNRLFGSEFVKNLASKSGPKWQKQSLAFLFAVIVLALSSVNVEAQPGKRAAIATRWAKDVDTANPLPEYPRPQMVRKDWLSLNGIWQFQSGLAGDRVLLIRSEARLLCHIRQSLPCRES